jgi:hypothetical protein
VNGVTDAAWVSLCFAEVKNGVEQPMIGNPFPPRTLAYANTITVDSVPGVDFRAEAVRPYVVAASPDAISGLNCASLVAIAGAFGGNDVPNVPSAPSNDVDGSLRDVASVPEASFDAAHDSSTIPGDAGRDGAAPRDGSRPETGARTDAGKQPVPNVRVAPLYVIPAGTFSADRHYLFALGGCMGGPGITDPSQQSVCGENFSPTHPTLTPVLATLSRIVADGRVGVQFLDATPAVRAADLHLTSSGLSTLTVARNVVVGAIRPTPPNTARKATDLGSEDHIQIFADGSTKPIYDEPWSTTLAVGDLSSLEDGHAYTLLLIGPYPGFSQREWWNDPIVTVVRN